MILAALLSTAHAQDILTLEPVLAQLESLLVELDNQQIQLTELSVGPLREDPVGASLRLPLAAGEDLRIIGLGDPVRMTDMDLYVLDTAGNVLVADTEGDNMPMLEFVAPRDGIYDLRVVGVEMAPDHPVGFYTLAVGYALDIPPVSATETLDETIAATLAMEQQGIQPITIQWRTLAEGHTAFVQHHIGESPVCTVFAEGTPSRTRRVDLYVGDPFDQPRAHDRPRSLRTPNPAFAVFEPTPTGEWIFALHAKKLKRGYGDTHGVLAVGCI